MENESVEAVEPQTEAIAQAEGVEPPKEPTPEPEAREEQPKPQEGAPNQPPKWALDRINEETNRRRQEAEKREAAEREAANLRELLSRLQKGDKSTETASQEPKIERRFTQDDVNAEAARQRFYEDTVAVRDAGLGAYPDFAQSLSVLDAAGATRSDVIADVMAIVGRDKAHDFLHKLAQDHEKAASIAKMDTRARIAQLTRMTMAESQPAPKPAETKPASVSKAPPPKAPLDPAASTMSDPNDLMDDNISDDEFHRRWKRKHQKAS